ncbi:MAG: type II toxin-antitoxin system HicA family toxin [Armatimonadetes bacterium]|nr:type II toxin-antitoxin system HicA family toxin [Armatimonadota bacterium]
MAYTYDQFRQVLRKAGFELRSSGKHEVWRRIEPDGSKRRVIISHSHQHGKDIPTWLFAKMLRQSGFSRDEFEKLLRDH